GGSVSGGKDALSPEERRLQAVESRVGVLARRLDAANLNEVGQDAERIRADARSLRGEVERLRYDFDQAQKRNADLEARIQRLEGGGLVAPGAAGAGSVPPSSAAAPVAAPPPATAAVEGGTLPAPAAP